MGVKFVRRIASEMLKRGESSIRINVNSKEEIEKAMTREDVRKLLKSGSVFALKEKRNISRNSKELKKRRQKGRSRGTGRRRGTGKARQGRLWKKKARSQRFLLVRLKSMGRIDRETFRRYYTLVKGNSFADKASLLLHMSEEGIKVNEAELKEINEQARKRYK